MERNQGRSLPDCSIPLLPNLNRSINTEADLFGVRNVRKMSSLTTAQRKLQCHATAKGTFLDMLYIYPVVKRAAGKLNEETLSKSTWMRPERVQTGRLLGSF